MAPPTKHPTDAILDATCALVLRQGPRAASIAAISAASGAPTGTLYHRFGSRDAVLAAVWLRSLARFQDSVMRRVAGEDPPAERGAQMAMGAMAFAHSHGDDARLLATVRRADLLDGDWDSDLRERVDEMNAPLAQAIRDIARDLYGSANRRSVEAVTRAVVDLPYAAIRRHAQAGQPPKWLKADVTSAVRHLLTAPLGA